MLFCFTNMYIFTYIYIYVHTYIYIHNYFISKISMIIMFSAIVTMVIPILAFVAASRIPSWTGFGRLLSLGVGT